MLSPATTGPEGATTRRLPLVALVCVFAVAALAAVVVRFVGQAWSTHESQSAKWVRETHYVAESFAQQTEGTFDTADAIVSDVQYVAEAGPLDAAHVRTINGLMRSRLRDLPFLHSFYVIDARGRAVFVSSRGNPQRGRSYAVRDWFRYHATHRRRDAYLGIPVRSRTDGSLVISVSRRLDNRDGSFRGVAVATIPLSYFVRLYRGFDLFPKATVTLVRDDGTIEARQPYDAALIGAKDAQFGTVFADREKASKGTLTVRSPIDRTVRLTAYSHSSAMPVSTIVGVPTDDAFAEWRRATIASAFMALINVVAIVAAAILLCFEIRARERGRVQLSNLAFLDGLTNVPNRRRFDATLATEWERAARDRRPIALLMVDVDSFKAYNDGHGHAQGDDVLRSIAATIRANIKEPIDLVARYGGEEFAIILPATPLAGGETIAETIRRAIVDLAIPHRGSAFGVVSVSIGVAAAVPFAGQRADDMLAAADGALYLAKAAGRNRVHAHSVCATPSVSTTAITQSA